MRKRGKLSQLVQRLALERAVKEFTDDQKTMRAWGFGYQPTNLYGDGDFADAYADHLPTPFGEQHLHLNWRWGNSYWNITTRRSKLCGTNRCRRVYIDVGEFRRVDQDAECSMCHLPAKLHPLEPNVTTTIYDDVPRPYLTRMCNGDLVKL